MSIGIGVNGSMKVGGVTVTTTSNEGLSVEYWAERLLDRILFVGKDSNPLIQEQALAYKEAIHKAIVLYMGHAINSDRTTLYGLLIKQGEPQMAEIIRKLSN